MEEILNIIAKKLKGEATEAELQQLARWVGESTENARLLKELEQTWAVSGTAAFDFAPDVEAAWERLRPQLADVHESATVRPAFRPIFRIAASFAIVLGLGAMLYLLLKKPEETRYTASSEKSHFTLPDGSEVWLNRNSELAVAGGFNEKYRTLRLSGEAFFEVKRDESKPFVIEAAGTFTRVLGTSFNINSSKANRTVEVIVVSGKVSFGNGSEEVLLQKGEAGIAASGAVARQKNSNPNFLSWKDGKLVFNDLALSDIIPELEEYFDANIEVRNNDILNCRFTGAFEQPGLEDVIEVISTAINLEYRLIGKKVVLSGDGCSG